MRGHRRKVLVAVEALNGEFWIDTFPVNPKDGAVHGRYGRVRKLRDKACSPDWVRHSGNQDVAESKQSAVQALNGLVVDPSDAPAGLERATEHIAHLEKTNLALLVLILRFDPITIEESVSLMRSKVCQTCNLPPLRRHNRAP